VLESPGLLLGEDDDLAGSLCESLEHLALASWSISQFGWVWKLPVGGVTERRLAGGPIRIGSWLPIL
jgi:hypothetical protein